MLERCGPQRAVQPTTAKKLAIRGTVYLIAKAPPGSDPYSEIETYWDNDFRLAIGIQKCIVKSSTATNSASGVKISLYKPVI
jgi:hypothetical protein